MIRTVIKLLISVALVFLMSSINNVAAQTANKSHNLLATNENITTGACRFAGLDEVGNLLFDCDGKDAKTVSMETFAWWNSPVESVNGALIQLADGSTLTGQVAFVEDDQIEISSKRWETIRLSLATVQSLELQISSDAKQRDLQRKQMQQGTETHVWLVNGDLLSGEFMGADLNDLSVRSANRVYQLPLEHIATVSFATRTLARDAGPPPSWEYSLIDGSRLRVSNIEFFDDRIIARCAGLTLSLQRKTFADNGVPLENQVCGIRNLEFDSDYLSKLAPIEYQHTPLLGRETSYQFDRSIEGTKIRAGETVFPFGIGMPSRSSVVFRIEEPGNEPDFQFGVAMDPSSGGKGSVVCKVLILDKENKWQTVWNSQVIRGNAQPIFSSVHLGQARAIALTVDFADNGDVLDRVNWIMPRLVR